MKKLTRIFPLVFAVMFSSTSFAEWTEVSKNVTGDSFHVDFENIREHDGFFSFGD